MANPDTSHEDATHTDLMCALLDKVGYAVIADFQKCQRHFMLKKLHMRPHGHKKMVCLELKCFYWVPLYGTIMFLYVQSLFMDDQS